MGRPQQQKRLAAVLRKTLKDLEAKTDTDPLDPAFIALKSHLVQRIIELEADRARARAVIQLVDMPGGEPEAPAVSAKDPDAAIA